MHFLHSYVALNYVARVYYYFFIRVIKLLFFSTLSRSFVYGVCSIRNVYAVIGFYGDSLLNVYQSITKHTLTGHLINHIILINASASLGEQHKYPTTS